MLGIKKYFTPANAPGRVTEYIVTTIAKSTRIGIMILDIRSTPFLTPPRMIIKINAAKTRNHSSV